MELSWTTLKHSPDFSKWIGSFYGYSPLTLLTCIKVILILCFLIDAVCTFYLLVLSEKHSISG